MDFVVDIVLQPISSSLLFLRLLQNHPLKFSLADLWDGRLILCIADEVDAARKVNYYTQAVFRSYRSSVVLFTNLLNAL